MKAGLEKSLALRGFGLQVVYTPPNRGKPNLKELVRIWRPAGVVVAVTDMQVADVDLPTVFLSVAHVDGGYDQVIDDSAEIGRMAAAELLSIGNASFAYVAHPGDYYWIGDRLQAFRKTVRSAGKRIGVCRLPTLRMDDCGLVASLRTFVRDLPKPCGIFAANDEIASLVVSVACGLGLRVPEDVAVVGVDDNPAFVENGQVHMTSIVPDWKKAGEEAGRILLGRILSTADGEKARPTCVKVPPLGVVRRASTHRMMRVENTIARKALAFIRDYATCGISSSDVVAHVGCSRSLANLRFREATGHSILTEIQNVRFEKARDLLNAGHHDVKAVAAMCGYSSTSFFRREFKARNGQGFR